MPARQLAGTEFKHLAYRCKATDLWPNDVKELSAAHQHDLDVYLGDFARPIRNIADEVSCFACGAQLTARTQETADKLGKTVECDEVTGEGRCLGCGYPLRALHLMYSTEGQLLVRLMGFPLLYHPYSTKRSQ